LGFFFLGCFLGDGVIRCESVTSEKKKAQYRTPFDSFFVWLPFSMKFIDAWLGWVAFGSVFGFGFV